MKNKKYHTVGVISGSNIKIVKRCKFETPKAQIHDLPLSMLDTGTSIQIDGVKLVICVI